MNQTSCPRCDTANPKLLKYCRACAMPLAATPTKSPSAKHLIIVGFVVLIIGSLIAIILWQQIKVQNPDIQSEATTVNIESEPKEEPVEDIAALKSSLQQDYQKVLQQSMSMYHHIHVELLNTKNGVTLYGVHSRFNNHSFNYGGLAGFVKLWVVKHLDDLKHAEITQVGVKGEHSYSGAITYPVK